MTTRSSIIVNNTEYIPAKEAEISFLIAIVGIVTGIVFGFFVLKLNFGHQNPNLDLPQSVPATYEQSAPLEYPEEIPVFDMNEEEGVRDYSV